ncbi:MAG: DUF5679 domain-containing protein, partial [Nitrososphaeraceae archaeon]
MRVNGRKTFGLYRVKYDISSYFISKHEIYLVLVTQAYCVKCKLKRDMKNEKQITMKNG